MVSRTVKDEKLVNIVKRIIEHFKITGFCEFEFIVSGNKYFLIDINFVPGGSIYLAKAAGANLPLACIKEAMGKPLEPFNYKENIYLSRIFWDITVEENMLPTPISE